MPRASTTPLQQSLLLVRRALDRGIPVEALRLADQALALATEPDDPVTVVRLRANRSAALAELGDPTTALADLKALVVGRADLDVWPLAVLALVQYRLGQLHESITSTDMVLGLTPEPFLRLRTLINRANLHFEAGSLGRAAADLAAAAELAAAVDDPPSAYAVRHNLGYLRYLAGDLPAALRLMEEAALALPEAEAGTQFLDRARVLSETGLVTEALALGEQALAIFTKERAGVDRVSTLILLADLHGRSGDLDQARTRSRQARRLSLRRGAAVPAMAARLTQLTWTVADVEGRALSRTTAEAGKLTAALEDSGGADEASAARLLWIRALIAAGDHDGARRELAGLRRHRSRIDIGLRVKRAAVESALASGSGRFAPLRRGLDELAQFQAQLGSADLQSGASAEGADLARTGLRLAVDTGSPATILHWLERSRAVTTRLPPVTPPTDPELAELLGHLRLSSDQHHQQRLSGRPDPALTRRIAELHDRIRQRTWTVDGRGRPERPVTLAAVQRRLAADPGAPAVVGYLTGRGTVRAVVITARHAHYVELGPWSDAAERHRRRHADLDLLAQPRIPEQLRAVAKKSVATELQSLQELLVDPLVDRLGAGPMVIAAVGALATVPWLMLPGLRSRPITVHSSVTAALRPAATAGRDQDHGVLAVAGPGVPFGMAEVTAVASTYGPDTMTLTGDAATGPAMLAAMPAGGILHIAAHGVHQPESPLFSSIQLADGPLFGYDFAPNPAKPAHVVLSSCDVGRSSLRPGDEPLGLAAAFLRSGVRTVVAGLAKVGDETAAATMSEYHRQVAAGAGSAVALAQAVAAVADRTGEPAPFTCFGGYTPA